MATVDDGTPTAVPDTERDPNYGEGTELEQEKTDRIITGNKVELQDSDAWDKLGYSFPTWRKWCVELVSLVWTPLCRETRPLWRRISSAYHGLTTSSRSLSPCYDVQRTALTMIPR